MKCKICGDPIRKCPRKSTNNWCHTWRHNHMPKPKNKSNILNIIVVLSIIVIFSSILYTLYPNINIDIKFPNILKNQPCVIQPSISGNSVGTISSGDCNELQKKGFSSDEQKLIGNWNYKTNIVSMTFTFNEDRSGTLTHSDYGKSHFKYIISNNKIIFSDTDGFIMEFLKISIMKVDESGNLFEDKCCNYKFINDKEIVISGITLDKSWW